MSNPRLLIDLSKITGNAQRALEIGRAHGFEVMGVTKGAGGLPEVARAMIAGGVKTLGDSRLDNIARLRAAGITAPITLLRSPGPSDVSRTVALADGSLNSDLRIIADLSAEARKHNKTHGVILMADLDTGREGLSPERIPAACRKVHSLPGIRLLGIGAYCDLTSGSGLLTRVLRDITALGRQVQKTVGQPIPVLSGGSSNILRTIAVEGHPNPGINHLRIGTAILLGFSSSLHPVTIDGFERDTFILQAEVIEVKANRPGEALLALGKLDTDPQFLFPLPPVLKVGDATSDHLKIVMESTPRVGEWVSFRLGYPALCRTVASPYVRIEFRELEIEGLRDWEFGRL